jgi:hypothetical protein
MTAIREAIFKEVEDRLNSLGVGEVERMPSGDPMVFPALHIFDGGQQTSTAETDVSRYDMSVLIEGYLEASGGSAGHTQLNDLYAAVVAVLIPEPPLGGLAETIDEGSLQITVAPLASARRLAFSLDFSVTFPTRRDDPAQSS